MERTNFKRLLDHINCSRDKAFTQIPNELLKNPILTAKAKIALCILLTNKKGWRSTIGGLCENMKEGKTAIKEALSELTKHGYYMNVRFIHKRTRRLAGAFHAYTDIPWDYDFTSTINKLSDMGMEIQPTVIEAVFTKNHSLINPNYKSPKLESGVWEIPKAGFPNLGNPTPNNTNSNKTKDFSFEKSIEEEVSAGAYNPLISKTTGYITKNKFETFWELYPKKSDKGRALTEWNKLCSKKDRSDVPTWITVKKALLSQKKSDRWAAGFIPMASTWIHQHRWLDDPTEMVSYKPDNEKSKPDREISPGGRVLDRRYVYREPTEYL